MNMTGHLGEAISAYLDGELDSAERREAESHVAGCERCREELDEMMVVRAQLRSLPMRELPYDLHATTDRVRPVYRRPRFVASAAAAVVALLAIATLTAPRDAAFAITEGEFQATYGARATLDDTFPIRSMYPAQIVTDDAENGGG